MHPAMTISSFYRVLIRAFGRSRLVGFVSLLAPGIAAAQACLPSDSISAFVQSKIILIATSTDTEAVHLRSVIDLPLVAADSIQAVSDSSTCATAAAKLASLTSAGDANPGAWCSALAPRATSPSTFVKHFTARGISSSTIEAGTKLVGGVLMSCAPPVLLY
jgi:hypothetical protein